MTYMNTLKVFILGLAITMLFFNHSIAGNVRPISVVGYADVAFCKPLGDVVGESRFYLTAATGVQNAKKEALSKAQQASASHLVWRVEKSTFPITVIGKAYDCNQNADTITSPSQQLLNMEYARLLGEATQGKISFRSAFYQLNDLRIKVASDNNFLSQYFKFLEEAAVKVDSKEMTFEEADKFLNERKNLISQILIQEMQQKISSQVNQQLKEDQNLKLQLEQTSANNNAYNATLMGLGLQMMNGSGGYNQQFNPPAQTTYSFPGSRPITCTSMNNGGYVSCF